MRLEKLSRYNVLLLVAKIRKIHTLRKTLKTDSKTDWSGGEQLPRKWCRKPLKNQDPRPETVSCERRLEQEKVESESCLKSGEIVARYSGAQNVAEKGA